MPLLIFIAILYSKANIIYKFMKINQVGLQLFISLVFLPIRL